MDGTSPSFSACIEACHACADACDHCATACLSEADPKALAKCISLDMDCAAMCSMAASAMARHSTHVAEICELCADICDACAEECGRHDMDHCLACAEQCHHCAQACRQVVHRAEQGQEKPGHSMTKTSSRRHAHH